MLLNRKLENILNHSDNDESPITMRALIDPNRPGALIGKGGIIHQQIEDMFKVRMVFHSNVDPICRLVTVYGHPAQVAQAWRDALLRMHGMKQFELNNDKELGLDFLIPKSLADKLVQDKTLAHIHVASKASLCLKPYPLPHTNEQVLQITVSNLYHECLNDFETAVRMLGQCFQDHQDLALSPLNVYYVPSGSRSLYNSKVHDTGRSTVAGPHSLTEFTKEDEQWHEQLLAE